MGKLVDYINKKKDSLKFSLVFYYMFIFFIFVSVFVVFSFFSVRDYYYNTLKNNMLSQSIYSTELYDSYISSYTLSDVVLNERFEFLNNIDGQVQLLDNNGLVYYDSLGSSMVGEKAIDPNSLLTNNESYKFVIDNIHNKMSLNYPITTNNSQIGILRTITSLDQVNFEIGKRMLLFILFGFISLMSGFALLYYFSGKLLKPVNMLTGLARKLSDGQYEEKSNMPYAGEIGELAEVMDQLSENILLKEEMKNDFISSVSHELRTPLTSIKGWALTLQDSSLDDETRNEGLKIIESESDRLSDMVEDLLDFSRFTSPSFTLSKSKLDLIPIVKNIVKQMRPRSNQKDVDLILDYTDNEVVLIADENRLKQVFINIIDNAIKFTDAGGSIVVSIELDKEKHIVKCSVIDSGIGISEEEINKVTTKFYKGSSAQSRTGLGLSICEEIIVKHNGKLEISSVLDKGTTVSFELPLAEDEDVEEE